MQIKLTEILGITISLAECLFFVLLNKNGLNLQISLNLSLIRWVKTKRISSSVIMREETS